MAGNLAGQAHAQAHVMAPSVIPAPTAFHASGTTSATGEVDRSEVIEPDNKQETAKFEKLFDSRPTADELVDKGILKGVLAARPGLLDRS